MQVWRIASAAQEAFDGEGARRYGSRWTSRGVAAVFTSSTLSLAVLERFVHTDSDIQPPDLVAISVDIGEEIAIESVDLQALPVEWRRFPPAPALTAIGDRWFQEARTAVLSVPSVVIPHERNFVLNPTHREFAKLAIGRAQPFSFDPRMWKS